MRSKKVVNQLLGDRVREAREAAGMTQPQLAEKLDQSQSSIAEIEAGHIRRPKKLREIAGLTKVSESWLLGETDSPSADAVVRNDRAQVIEVPIVGVVEAGAFREVDPFSDALEAAKVLFIKDNRFPEGSIAAFKVAGDSMNELGILDGHVVITVNYIQSGLELKDGMLVVVERTRDDGHTIEWTVKEIRIFRDRLELVPRSKNPIHKTMSFPRGECAADIDGYRVSILAIVLQSTQYHPI